ncbi:neural cell adhesion molecule 1-like [Uloborus diversus]|uniref:neural cell adhesion molecule 1-like n=1 Tax=Uloborus diversus TaxID=327109 RepID=UPI00240A71C7|nr:neural cell adhesion molecule 1-like [Uloborus diversus]
MIHPQGEEGWDLELARLHHAETHTISVQGLGGIPGIKIKSDNNLEDTTEYPELFAVIGSAVSLPCDLTTPSNDDIISTVLWYRLDLKNPVYTLDYRTVPSSEMAKHFSSKVLGSRAYFNVSRHSSAHLRLDPVDEDDAGEYRCRIDFKRGRTLSRLVKLNVIVPVKKVHIKGRGNISYSGLIGPFTEGMSLALICEARGGFPTPTVIWRKGSRILAGNVKVDEIGVVRNEFIFNRLRREDLLTVLTCQASNNNLTGPVYTSVTLDLNLKPQSVQITTAPSVLKAGQRIEVNCQSEGSRPPARISWIKGSERVDHQAIQNTFGSISVSTLSFAAAAEDNGKKLTCEAQNPELPESALQDSWNLSVLYPPQLSLVFGASEQYEHIREGSDVYFECNIQANPPVTEVRWRFQSRNLVHDPLRGIIVRNHSLLLHNVGKRHRGTYQCLASNTQGRGRSEEVVLRIQYSPICNSHQRRNYGIAKDEQTNVSCTVDADPLDVIFSWAFNNSLSENMDIYSFESISGSQSVAKYTPKKKSDYGFLYCFAKNNVGSMREPCIFNIVPIGPPDPLQNCTITNQSFSALTLSCEAGDDGGTQQNFHLEIYSMKREQLLANITSYETPNFIVKGLPTGTSFIVVIYSSNSKGRSTSVALTAATLFSAERQMEEDSKSVISAVLLVSLAALGTLALLAVAAVVAVIKNKTRTTTNEVTTSGLEMTEKIPKTSKHSFEDGNPYVYHTREVPTEYVHLTPKPGSDCLYESLMDGKPSSFGTVLCKAHVLNEEGLEVIIPVIER